MFRVVLVTLAMALPAAAHAGSVSMRFCTDLEVSFRDGAVGDLWAGVSRVDARYIRTEVVRNDGVTVWSGYADSAGCTPALSVSTYRSYVVKARSDFRVSGDNRVVVYDDATSPSTYVWSSSAYRPTASSSKKTNVWPLSASGASYASNLMAVAHRAVDIQHGSASGELFVFFHEACPGGTGSCLRSTTLDDAHESWPTTYISDSDGLSDRSKFIMAHEIGHLVPAILDEHKRVRRQNDTADHALDSSLSVCATGRGHTMDSEEWQNTAANEGFAHFYAAALWNDRSPTDCDFWQWKPVKTTIACDVSEGWLEDACYGGKSFGQRTGNEGDWLSLWWRLHAEEGYSVTELLDAWDEANPSAWGAAADGWDVYWDLRAGAVAAGVDAATWDDVAAGVGVDH